MASMRQTCPVYPQYLSYSLRCRELSISATEAAPSECSKAREQKMQLLDHLIGAGE
jgi:hypothetical protein